MKNDLLEEKSGVSKLSNGFKVILFDLYYHLINVDGFSLSVYFIFLTIETF